MVSIDRSYNPLPFQKLFKLFLKDPGPLNSIKRVSAVKQLKLGQISIMWRPLQKSLQRYALSLISNNIGKPHTVVDSVSVWGIPPSIFKLKMNITCHASSRGRKNGGLGHTVQLSATQRYALSLLIFCPGMNSTAVDLKIYILSMILSRAYH